MRDDKKCELLTCRVTYVAILAPQSHRGFINCLILGIIRVGTNCAGTSAESLTWHVVELLYQIHGPRIDKRSAKRNMRE